MNKTEIIEKLNESQLKALHAFYQNEWWSKGRTLVDVVSCVNGSQICIGLIDEQGELQAFARVLTDYTFKALVFDLIVSDKRRCKGLGSKIMLHIKEHPKLQKVKHFELYCLPEMFTFYEQYGFSTDVGEIKLMRFVNN